MRILLKCPTRTRPEKVVSTLGTYVRLANQPKQLGIAVSCDVDDESMRITTDLTRILNQCAWGRIFYGTNRTKIEACNANMEEIDFPWDIVVLVSDDMIPQIRGYDDVIRNHMMAQFPNTDGILWFNDGTQGDKLNTLTIFGRKMYESFGYLYNPEYKSLFCDTELTDQCRTTHAQKTSYIPYVIIRHEHPGAGYVRNMDGLYQRNQTYWNEDMYTYIRRKAYELDMTFLIPTIPGREESLRRLMGRIHDTIARVCPNLRYEIRIDFDAKESSIGIKRQRLLQAATGKYLAFIDDDDDITDVYIEDLWATIQGSYPVMRLRGQIQQYTFTHSIGNKLTDSMAHYDVFIRPPNHLNPMMSDVAKLIPFRDAVRGEDLDWAIRLARTGFLTREYQSDQSRIHYIYNTRDPVNPQSLVFQRQTSYETMLRMVWTPNGAKVSESTEQPKSQIPVLRLGPRGFVSK